MAQATDHSTTSPSRFHNHADPALADVISHVDAAVIMDSSATNAERSMFPPTRRSFIHTIAALSIAAAASPASAQTIDADLITLSARFEPLVDQYYVARKSWARSMVAAHAEYRASAERHYQVLEDCCERSGANEAGTALSAIEQKMEELAMAINAAPVRSIAGLRAKAMVALWKVAPKYAHDAEFSFERPSAFQQLFTAVAELCGLENKMVAIGYQLPDVTMMDADDVGGQEIGAARPVSITIR